MPRRDCCRGPRAVSEARDCLMMPEVAAVARSDDSVPSSCAISTGKVGGFTLTESRGLRGDAAVEAPPNLDSPTIVTCSLPRSPSSPPHRLLCFRRRRSPSTVRTPPTHLRGLASSTNLWGSHIASSTLAASASSIRAGQDRSGLSGRRRRRGRVYICLTPRYRALPPPERQTATHDAILPAWRDRDLVEKSPAPPCQ